MKLVLILTLIALTVALANSQSRPCTANKIYWPVCGSDGKTYANKQLLGCEARIRPGLTLVYEGRCGRGNGQRISF